MTVSHAISARMRQHCWQLLLYLFLGLSARDHQKREPALTQSLPPVLVTPGSYRHFTPWKKGDRHCKDKVNLDDVTKPERCPSFRLSSVPSEELCYPPLSPGVSTKAPCNWKPVIPARDQRSLRHPSLHPSAPVWSPSDTASRCPPHGCSAASHCSTHPRASLPTKKSTVCLCLLKMEMARKGNP